MTRLGARPARLCLRLRRLAAIALLWPALACAQPPPVYRLDPVHTRILFAIDHAGYSKALGTVSGSTGTLRFDPDDWHGAQLDVRIPLHRLDLGDAAWNEATLARNLLDGKRFPEARFVSTRVEPAGPDRAMVTGMLTLRGVTREVRMDVRLNSLRRSPLPPFRRTAGFSAVAAIRRSDFGILAWPALIGDEVTLRIEAEAVRDGAAHAPALPDGRPCGAGACANRPGGGPAPEPSAPDGLAATPHAPLPSAPERLER